MAFARMGVGGSDVYVYYDVGGFYSCCFCTIFEDGFTCQNALTMIHHLEIHRRGGDCVPDHTFEDLEKEPPGDADEVCLDVCNYKKKEPQEQEPVRAFGRFSIKIDGEEYALGFKSLDLDEEHINKYIERTVFALKNSIQDKLT